MEALRSVSSRFKVQPEGGHKTVKSEDDFKYTKLAEAYFRHVDHVHEAENPELYYYDNVAPLQDDDVSFDIHAGSRVHNLKGKDAVKDIFVSLGTRSFSYHTISDVTVSRLGWNKWKVHLRYHGVVKEEGAEHYQDVYGVAELILGKHDLVSEASIVRSHTINRYVNETE